jgi:tRNA G18 (ribose-2'-O)-methylase SpoU
MKSNAVLILHDIRSAQNVGSLFRTADAAGISKIYLSVISPTPIDRFGRPVGAIAKTALGAEQTIPWETYTDIKQLIVQLQKEGIHIIAIEQSVTAIDYKEIRPSTDIACILGNEVEGISQDILDMVDTVVEIPMRGQKESLNVSVAGGIALFRILNI